MNALGGRDAKNCATVFCLLYNCKKMRQWKINTNINLLMEKI